MIPFGEFAPDLAKYNLEVSEVADNVLAGANSYLPMKALTSAGQPLDEPCRGAITLKDNDGTSFVYAGDAKKLYYLTSATTTDYSKAGGYADNDEFWTFEKWGEQVIASKFGDTPQILTLGGPQFADLSGSPPQARAMAVIRDFVVMGNTFDITDGNQPQRVWWSGFDDETQWTPGENQSNYSQLEGTGGNIQRIVGGEYGIIFMESSIWRMDYAGVPTVFEFDEIEPGRGTPAPGSVVEVGSDIYFLGQDGFYVLTNGTVSEQIGEGKIDRFFWDSLNGGFLQNISAASNPETGHIFWAFPSNQSPNGVPDRLLIYNYKIRRWSTATVSIQYLFVGAGNSFSLDDLDPFGNLDTLGISLDSAIWQGGALKLAAFDTSNTLAFFSGDVMSATVETGKIYTEGRKTQLTGVRPIIDGTSEISALTRENLPGDPEVLHGPMTVDASGKADFRTNARYHRIRATTIGNFNHATGVEADQVATDDR